MNCVKWQYIYHCRLFQVDPDLENTAVVEWYKDDDLIKFKTSNNFANCEYCEDDDEEYDSRYIRHSNNSITIQKTTEQDVGTYTCHVDTDIGEPFGKKI